jgi:hypothetical protein
MPRRTIAQRLVLTPAEIAACVRRLGQGRSLVSCLRQIETQRALALGRAPITTTKTRTGTHD